MKYREEIEKIFGTHAFDHSLFYQYENALRFELSESGSAIEMFTTAWKKADEILSDALHSDGNSLACWSFYGPSRYLSSLSAFREITSCEIVIPKLHQSWSEADMDSDENHYRHFICFIADKTAQKKLIWGALAQDLGIRPRITGKVHIANLERKILVHPYDDRGMDITSTDHEFMKELFDQYNHYLLGYDREIMERYYSKSSSSESS